MQKTSIQKSAADRRPRRPQGFTSIIALSLFSVMMIFAAILAQRNLDTLQSIRNMNNYYAATDVADSFIEFLQKDLKNHEYGYNNDFDCVFKYGELVENESTGDCSQIAPKVALWGENEKIKLKLEVTGRTRTEEGYQAPLICGDYLGYPSCYAVPAPGTGSAGDSCQNYRPPTVANASGENAVTESLLPAAQANGLTNAAHLDHACNWNKLQMGSSTTQRVTIPLYYQDSGGQIINPFKGGQEDFLLRLRTPCKPCQYIDPDDTSTPLEPGKRRCAPGHTTNVCDYSSSPTNFSDYFVLNSRSDREGGDGNQIIAQWQISGDCEQPDGSLKACTLLPVIKSDQLGIFLASNPDFSGITEWHVNEMNLSPIKNGVILPRQSKAINTLDYSAISKTLIREFFQEYALKNIQKPVLTLFLNHKLLTADQQNIPYLEYQLLSSAPISGSTTTLKASVIVNNSGYEKTIKIENRGSLVDFAVQN